MPHKDDEMIENLFPGKPEDDNSGESGHFTQNLSCATDVQ